MGADNVTLPPVQKLVALLAVMVGLAGKAFTVTVVASEVILLQPLLFVIATVYNPPSVTLIDCVVAPLLHR